VSVRIATDGSATTVTASPRTLTVCVVITTEERAEPSWVPQLAQKRAPSVTGEPQVGQATAIPEV